ELFWDFSMSGLPQMLMLFLFSGATYVMIRLVEAHTQMQPKLRWSAALGALFGLLALAHGLTLFVFLGALVFAICFFRPWGRDAAVILAVCALFYVPWMVRNYRICGSPVGIGWYSGLAQVTGSESKIMRTMSLDDTLKEITPRNFTLKLRTQLMGQFSDIYRALGSIVVAPVFFLALLHIFKKPETALFRWWVLCMWLFAVFGMAVFGLEPYEQFTSPSPVKANDINVLFIPLMTFYGLAFVLVLWSRLEIYNNLLRYGFVTLLFLISSLPFIIQFIDLQKLPTGRVQWPPYVPPSISMLNTWTRPNEIIMSDMPWAVAWYADRKSLWVPMTVGDFITLTDWEHLGGRIIGLYLTPITGNKPFLAGVVKGEYKAWAPFILRQVGSLKDFPLHAMTGMEIEKECVFYADRDRWSAVED
ncbi:MAG: hypothetical protein JWL90_4134, partial [Chthoniobacteraceae bacterium]|nr:hypothetical protein [Chthoniobacteraceae bacterium]